MVSLRFRPALIRASATLTAAALTLVVPVLGAGIAAAAEPDAQRVGNVAAWGDREPANDHQESGGTTGDNFYGQQDVPADLATVDVSAVAASSRNSMALDTTGHVHVWGDPGNVANGWSTAPPAELASERVTAIDTGTGWMIARTDDGIVHTWGTSTGPADTFAVPNTLAGKNVTAVSAGFVHALALTDESGGKVYAWGANTWGETTVPVAAQSNVVAISAGWHGSLAVKSDGTLVYWGYDPGDATSLALLPTVDVGHTFVGAALGDNQAVAFDNAGKGYAWGWNSYDAATIPAALTGKQIVSVASGERMSAAVTSDGAVVTWGYDGYTGTGSATSDSAYVPSTLTAPVTQVDVGVSHVVARIRPDLAGATAPAITGSARVGSTLTAKAGTTSPSATGVSFRWLRNGAELAATGATYKPVSADVGKRLSVRVTQTKDGYGSLTRVSAQTAVVVRSSTTKASGTTSTPRKVTLTIRVYSSGVLAANLDGRCAVLRGTKSTSLKSVSACTVKDGKGAITLTSQPTGRIYYAVRFDGITNKIAKSTSTPFSLTVR